MLERDYRLRAEEAQLLKEEKWIINSLRAVREQLNCLQIERLHLTTLLEEYEGLAKTPSTEPTESKPDAENLSKSAQLQKTEAVDPDGIRAMGFQFDEGTDEVLNLTVSKSVFCQQPHEIIEEFEEEYDMDSEDGDENVVDMIMLMDLKSEQHDKQSL